ncbi:MAG: hypothetical protein VX494_03585 [Actinomycetota bacterium]|nr:hypothetical protein [Actinomycetota bacterium]
MDEAREEQVAMTPPQVVAPPRAEGRGQLFLVGVVAIAIAVLVVVLMALIGD